VFSVLTVSVNGDMKFEKTDNNSRFGILHISQESDIIINDGQHRHAAIAAALEESRQQHYQYRPKRMERQTLFPQRYKLAQNQQ
jgi:DNA sulfur modification protein DndB